MLGATLADFGRVILPSIAPALLTGFALAFARGTRRVRLGGVHLRQHARPDRDRAAADRHASWSSTTTPAPRPSPW